MSSVASVQTVRTAACPHGLPSGACPLCNGMGGGARPREAEPPKKTGEWTWMQCYLAGRAMQAQKESASKSAALFEAQINFLRQMSQSITALVDKIQNALNAIEKSLPPGLQKPFAAISKNILAPLLRALENLPKALEKIERALEDLRAKVADVAQKLSALLGEVKNFADRKLVKNLKRLTRRLLGFFIWEGQDESFEEDETSHILKLKGLRALKRALKKFGKKAPKEGVLHK